MFINRSADHTNNLCRKQVARYRKELRISQRELADRLQLIGLDIDKNAIQRIESGQRFVTDIELKALGTVLDRTLEALIGAESTAEKQP